MQLSGCYYSIDITQILHMPSGSCKNKQSSDGAKGEKKELNQWMGESYFVVCSLICFVKDTVVFKAPP